MLNINGYEWEVRFVPPTHPALQVALNQFTLGVCNNLQQIIYINNRLSPPKRYKVLSHEITHAFLYSYHLNLNLPQEEFIADFLSSYGKQIVLETENILRRR